MASPRYVLGEVTTREELDGIAEVIWAAMQGVDRSHSVFYPTFGLPGRDSEETASDMRARAIASTKTRLWDDHESDSSSHWLYIRDETTGEIVAGCQWRLYEQNPFPNGPPVIAAMWWPSGSGRRFASEVVNQCFRMRATTMARPHVGLSLMCVLPALQRHGLGSILMRWGLERADALGVEMFIEATPPGRKLYEAFGFRSVYEFSVDMSRARLAPDTLESKDWQTLQNALLPIGHTAVWRPIRGVWEEDEPEKTFAPRLQEYLDRWRT